MSLMQRFVDKSYGHFLFAKILQAILSIPVFVILFQIITILGLILWIAEIAKLFCLDFIPGIFGWIKEYWDRPYFSNFNRSVWGKYLLF